MTKLQTLSLTRKAIDLRQVQPLSDRQNYGKGRGGRPWRRQRERILVKGQYSCVDCGLVTDKLHCDHDVPKSQGGSEDESNLKPRCKECHEAKSAREALEGRKGRGAIRF